jgi:hypothetical protein
VRAAVAGPVRSSAARLADAQPNAPTTQQPAAKAKEAGEVVERTDDVGQAKRHERKAA